MKQWLPPIRIEPYPSESLPGFVIRLCDVNGWWSYRDLALKLDLKPDELRYQSGDLRSLEKRLGLAAGTLPLPGSRHGHHQAVIAGQSLSGRHLHKDRRVCPACLAETGYQRSYWDFTFITRCHIHGTAFATLCACGRPLKWSDPALASCKACLTKDVRLKTPECVPERPFQVWCLRALGVTSLGDPVAAMEGINVHHALTMVAAIGLLHSSGYSKSRPEHHIADDQLREDGFNVIVNDQLGALIVSIVEQYRAEGGADCPFIPADALGWFGDLLLLHTSDGGSPLMAIILESLSSGLGYAVIDPSRSNYVSIRQLSIVTGMSAEIWGRALFDIGQMTAAITVGENESVVPVTLVAEMRRAIGG